MPPEHGKPVTPPGNETESARAEPETAEPIIERTSPRRKRPWNAPWLLPLAFILSVLVHLLVGYGTEKLGLFRADLPPPTKNEVEVTFRAPLAAQSQDGAETPANVPTPAPTPLAAITPTPMPTPVASFENFTRPPLPERMPTVPDIQPTPVSPVVVTPVPSPQPSVTLPPQPTRPTVRVPSDVKIVAIPSPVPTRRDPTTTVTLPPARQNSPAILPDRQPEPLPRGDLSADPAILNRETTLKPTTRQTANHATEPETPGGGSNAGGAVRITGVPTEPAAANPARTPGTDAGAPDAGSGGGRGDAVGAAAGAGKAITAALGINRGIPFGDKLGIYGGNPAGGGGGRAVEASVTRTAGGGVRVSLKRQQGADVTPVHILYVLDVSSSMSESGKIRKAREALNKALDELQPDDTFGIITFGTNINGSTRMLTASRANLAVGHANINAIDAEPNSSTNLSGALELALSQPDVTHIFVLSDGVPTEGIVDPDELLTFARQRNNGKARIITYALLGHGEGKKGFDFLKNLATQNNGHFEYVKMD